MKLSAILPAALFYNSICAALEEAELIARDTTCSLGIGRVSGEIKWDVTIYNVAASQRQDVNILTTATGQAMDKGDSINVSGITITNVDNVPVFDYDVPELRASLSDPTNGLTKVDLSFELDNLKWSTEDCSPGNVIFSAGRESWSCDFACGTLLSAREL